MEKLGLDEKKKIQQIKKNVIERVCESYSKELEELYKSKREKDEDKYIIGSATEHHFSEDQISLKSKQYNSRKVRESKYNEVKQILNQVISWHYGLVDDSWNIFQYPVKDVEEFLFTLVSLRYENERFIYYDKIEKDSNRYNKNIIGDLHKGNYMVFYNRTAAGFTEMEKYKAFMISNHIQGQYFRKKYRLDYQSAVAMVTALGAITGSDSIFLSKVPVRGRLYKRRD